MHKLGFQGCRRLTLSCLRERSCAAATSRPEPPYWAVIFTTRLREPATGYHATAEAMEKLAEGQPGYLGIESARGADGIGVTVSYWRAKEDFEKWRHVTQHSKARDRGRSDWYDFYELRYAKVEHAVGWSREDGVHHDSATTPEKPE
mmetsp:Transcript_45013/g.106927  ORF Transcript_45013/g.106927 Transcript_45013/m.106927 type:complete len:147 (+) Transcript_45013:60-500(+)